MIPLQGSGQGNGARPIIWGAISVILLTIMRDEEYDLDTLSYLSQLALVVVSFVFVDDIDITNAAKSVNTSGEELLKQQQQVVNIWEGLLRAIGGMLRLDKSYWHILD